MKTLEFKACSPLDFKLKGSESNFPYEGYLRM